MSSALSRILDVLEKYFRYVDVFWVKFTKYFCRVINVNIFVLCILRFMGKFWVNFLVGKTPKMPFFWINLE